MTLEEARAELERLVESGAEPTAEQLRAFLAAGITEERLRGAGFVNFESALAPGPVAADGVTPADPAAPAETGNLDDVYNNGPTASNAVQQLDLSPEAALYLAHLTSRPQAGSPLEEIEAWQQDGEMLQRAISEKSMWDSGYVIDPETGASVPKEALGAEQVAAYDQAMNESMSYLYSHFGSAALGTDPEVYSLIARTRNQQLDNELGVAGEERRYADQAINRSLSGLADARARVTAGTDLYQQHAAGLSPTGAFADPSGFENLFRAGQELYGVQGNPFEEYLPLPQAAGWGAPQQQQALPPVPSQAAPAQNRVPQQQQAPLNIPPQAPPLPGGRNAPGGSIPTPGAAPDSAVYLSEIPGAVAGSVPDSVKAAGALIGPTAGNTFMDYPAQQQQAASGFAQGMARQIMPLPLPNLPNIRWSR